MVSRVLACVLTWLLAVGIAEAAEPVLHMTVQPYNEEGISTAVATAKGCNAPFSRRFSFTTRNRYQ